MAKKLEEIKEEECPYELPEGWKWERLGNVAKRIKRGKSPKYTEKSNVLVFAQKCNQKNGEISLDKALFLDLEKLSKYKDDEFLCRKDVVVNSTGTGTLGRVGFFDMPLIYDCDRIVPDSHVTVIRASGIILSECLYYYLKSKQTLLESLGEGSTNQKELKVATLKNLLLPLPSKEIQQKIVDIIESLFAKLDIAQEKVEQVLAESENRRSAILHNAFSGKLTEKWREENNVSFDSWLQTIISNVCDKITCGKTPKEYITSEGEVPFLKVYNIVDNKVDFINNAQFIPFEIHQTKLKSSILKPKDIIMNIVGPPLRKIAIIPNDYPEWNINQAIVRFRAKEAIYYKFLYYMLINPATLDDIINETKGVVGQANISVTQSRNLKIDLPTISEQKEIVRLLDKFLSVEDKVKSTCQSTLESIATMRKSILAKAFRGELCS